VREHSNLQINYFSKQRNVLIEAERNCAARSNTQEIFKRTHNSVVSEEQIEGRAQVALLLVSETNWVMLNWWSENINVVHDSLLEFGAQFTNSNDLGDLRDAFSLHLHDTGLHPAQSTAAIAGSGQDS
jgi:hypothetical protein